MRFSLGKAAQAVAHPELIELYLGGLRRLRQNTSDYRKGLLHVPHLPSIVRVEVTNRCNLRCVMCPTGNRSTDSATGFMDWELYRKIVEQASRFPRPTWVILYLGGEPLLHERLPDMVRYARGLGLHCRFNTNATLLTPDKSKMMLQSRLDCIGFSFDDVSPAEYEAARQNAKYHRTLSNILEFLRLKEDAGRFYPLVTIDSVRLREGSIRPFFLINAEFKRLFRGHKIQNFASVPAHLWAGEFGDNKTYQYKRVSYYAGECSMPWSDLTINWEGKVVACCYDLRYDCVLGDVTKSSLIDVWSGEPMVELRRKLRDRRYSEIPLCRNCSLARGEVRAEVG